MRQQKADPSVEGRNPNEHERGTSIECNMNRVTKTTTLCDGDFDLKVAHKKRNHNDDENDEDDDEARP